jgi:two-component system sensor histidine kinase GlrK
MLFLLSFRQLLLSGFLFVAILLSAISVHTLLTFERLTRNNSAAAQQMLVLTEETQRLAERTVAMERSARQFLILNDPAFRQIFFTALKETRTSLKMLTTAIPDLPESKITDWHNQSLLIWTILQDVRETDTKISDKKLQVLNGSFEQLSDINYQLVLATKQEIERRNELSLVELERQRRLLSLLVIGALILAILLAFLFGLWLSRPLAQIKEVIGRLGDNKFDQTVDVSGPADIRRLGQQLDWLRQRLAELESDKIRFLRHISHELKTPLSALREGVALMEDEIAGKLTEKQHEIVRILRENTASLQNQIESLLRYNTATFDAKHLYFDKIDVVDLLRSVIDDQRLQSQARKLQVQLEEHSGPALPIMVDAEKIGVAFANLLANAIRFSPYGGIIRFIITAFDRTLRIDCIDQGSGVATADALRIFEPFYQGARQPTGARSGNGIGLSIVREYIVAHAGKVELISTDAGAHFRMELPYEQ